MGYFDGKDLDSAVMIRFVEQEGGKMYFKSGGGITDVYKRQDSGLLIVSTETDNEYVEPLIQEVYHEICLLYTSRCVYETGVTPYFNKTEKIIKLVGCVPDFIYLCILI